MEGVEGRGTVAPPSGVRHWMSLHGADSWCCLVFENNGQHKFYLF